MLFCGKLGHVRANCFSRFARKCKVGRASHIEVVPRAAVRGHPRIEAQVGHLRTPGLLDSGSTRSLISFEAYKQLKARDMWFG
jgi:hypothetical protein